MTNFLEGRVGEQKFQDGHLFPKVLVPAHNSHKEDFAAASMAVEENRAWIEQELHECGAILFRGFGLKSAEDFNSFVEALGWEEQPYKGPAPRKNIVGRVWSANEAPLHQHIFFHHEMALTKEFPSKIIFYCEVAPPEGGETAIVQSHRVAAHMEHNFPEVVQQLDTNGIFTHTLLPKNDNLGYFLGKSWQSHLQTDNPKEAQRKVEDGGGKLQWMEDGSANIIAGPIPATRSFQGYGDRKVWFNYIPAATYGKNEASLNRLICGDGSDIPERVMEESGRIMDEESVDVKWEAGDVLLIDNLAVMHARRPSKGPRRVLVAICK
ncbi:hypothetical protein SUGI_1017090 [Cryptomeria japonica]|uniref:clavaminate synthase-like protein At3g21360 n=1 Tax=Cryptomeria japonica TaxID=3369 RepID=UPI00241493CD|nr:clavaminate synthase-like protein At3g21360 [Cryptomeria japonica]GLJ48167.1 hypothetical protein SUGI_1017090 [Cryptomeria japonica]